jgi:type II secretory pathway component PulF
MPLFRYTGRDSTGRGTTGTLEAQSELDVAKVIEASGFYVTSIEPAAKAALGRKDKIPFFAPRITRRDLIVLLRQIETLYRSGVPIATGLDVLERQTENPTLRGALRTIAMEVREGVKLSEAFERHPKLFPPIITANLVAGEETGALEEVLGRVAEHLEHEDELERYVKGSLRYPTMVLVVLCAVIAMIILFVFPRMAPLFRLFGNDLPLPTKILKAVGEYAAVYAPPVIAALGVAFVAFQVWKRSHSGRPVWEMIVLRTPKVGPIFRKLLVARFARGFAVVFRTGVPLLRALDIVSATLDHRVLAKHLAIAKQRMSGGIGIAEALSQITIFPPLANHMLAVGEQTGRIEDLCGFLAGHYEEEARYDLKTLLMLIEPALTVVLAFFIGMTALAVFMPMWNMIDVVNRH